jgi:hypothetical protein
MLDRPATSYSGGSKGSSRFHSSSLSSWRCIASFDQIIDLLTTPISDRVCEADLSARIRHQDQKNGLPEYADRP